MNRTQNDGFDGLLFSLFFFPIGGTDPKNRFFSTSRSDVNKTDEFDGRFYPVRADFTPIGRNR